MKKLILLDAGYALLGEEPPEEARSKKIVSAEKKRLKEMRERFPVKIEVKFCQPEEL